MLKSMKSSINETLTSVAQYFGQLIELVLTHEVQVSLQYKMKSNNNNKHLHRCEVLKENLDQEKGDIYISFQQIGDQ